MPRVAAACYLARGAGFLERALEAAGGHIRELEDRIALLRQAGWDELLPHGQGVEQADADLPNEKTCDRSLSEQS